MKANIKDFVAAHPLPYEFSVVVPRNCLGWSIGAPYPILHDGKGNGIMFDQDEFSAKVAVDALNNKYGAVKGLDEEEAPFCQRHLVAPFEAVYDRGAKVWKVKDANGKEAFFGWYEWKCAEAIMEMAKAD